MHFPVVQAKLRPPKLPHAYISRPRLLQQLEEGVNRKLTLLIAGAGYGKSSLLAEWTQQQPAAVWYSLDAFDRDPAVFTTYLLNGLRSLWSGFGRSTQNTLSQHGQPDPTRLALSLLSDLEAALANGSSKTPLLIILDDYHRLRDDTAVDQMVRLLLERLPASLHVAISSRTPLPFTGRLRAAGQVNEVTATHLRFTSGETRQLFPTQDELDDALQHLLARSEGWPAGVQLVRQALRNREVLDIPALNVARPREQIYTYLAGELFARQSPGLQQFLLQTAILDTFSPGDSDAIFGRSDSARWLTHLEQHNLFTIQLQRDPGVYRYHHLLVDFLREKLRHEAGDNMRVWHRHAAVHYRQKQQWDDAFAHAIEATDEHLAANIVLDAFSSLRRAGRLDTLQVWLNRLAADIYLAHPALYCCQGHLWEDQGKHEQASGAFRQAIAIANTEDDAHALFSAWHGLGMMYQRTGELEAAHDAFQQALDFADQTAESQYRWSALNGLAMIHLYSGRNREALTRHRQCLELAATLGEAEQALVMSNLGTDYTYLGEFGTARYWYESALSLRRKANLAPAIVIGLTNLSTIHIRTVAFDDAHACLAEAEALLAEHPNQLIYSYTLTHWGVLAASRGNLEAAEDYYRRALEMKEPLQDVVGLVDTWTELGELRRRQSRLEEAMACAERALELGKNGAVGLNERLPTRTLHALVQLNQGEVNAAADHLAEIMAGHRQMTENKYELARCLWYLAQAHRTLGRDPLEPLAEALALAERWQYNHLLQSLAQEQPDLLVEAIIAELQPGFVQTILEALADTMVPALARLLTTSDPAARIQAIETLAGLSCEGVWQPLTAASDDLHPDVRRAARAALKQLEQTPPPPLRVTTLGRFTLNCGNRPILDSDWRNRKALSLFKYLLAHHDTPIHREELMASFWPEKPASRANHNLNQALSELRTILEPYLPPRTSRYLLREGQTYRLVVPEESWIDDEAFEQAVREALQAQRQGALETAMNHYETAVDLYQGEYLAEDRYDDWCAVRREQLSLLAIQALEALATIYLERGEPGPAAALSERIVALEPLHEAGYYLLMQAYAARAQIEVALRTFRQCEERLRQELDVTPSPHLRELYEQIVAQS